MRHPTHRETAALALVVGLLGAIAGLAAHPGVTPTLTGVSPLRHAVAVCESQFGYVGEFTDDGFRFTGSDPAGLLCVLDMLGLPPEHGGEIREGERG